MSAQTNGEVHSVTPNFSYQPAGETSGYLVVDESLLVWVEQPVSFELKNLGYLYHPSPENGAIEEPIGYFDDEHELDKLVSPQAQNGTFYNLSIKSKGIEVANRTLSFKTDGDSQYTEAQILSEIIRKFLAAISPSASPLQPQNLIVETSPQKQTKLSDEAPISTEPKQSESPRWKKMLRPVAIGVTAFLVLFTLVFLFLIFGGDGNKTNISSGEPAQINQQYIEALSKNQGAGIDINAQTRLTEETLKSMGLDPGKAAEIGCLAKPEEGQK